MFPLRIELENTNLTTYRVERSGNIFDFASNQAYISLWQGDSQETGVAEFVFDSLTGVYDVVIGYYDEDDGVSFAQVSHEGVLLDAWNFDQNLGNSLPSAQTFVQRTIATGITINSGDVFEIKGTEDGSETARIDYVEFIPVDSQLDSQGEPIPVESEDSQPPTDVINFNNYTVESYGSIYYDINSHYTIEDNGASLNITGNGWKKIALPYTLTANTVIEFDFQSDLQGEIHGIGFDDDDTIDTPSRTKIFSLFGTQNWSSRTASEEFNTYDSLGGIQHYSIPVGQFYTGDMSYLTFINDHDVNNPDAQSIFSNIRIYELADTIAPIATVNASNLTTTISSTSNYQFSVTYTDDVAVDVSSLDNSDVLVTDSSGVTYSTSLVSVNSNSANSTATYQINSLGESWNTNDNRNYTIAIVDNQVFDTSGNSVEAATVGSFSVEVTETTNDNNIVNYSSAQTGIIARLDQNLVYTPKYDEPIKVMALGDSITHGYIDGTTPSNERVGYRLEFWNLVEEFGLEIDYVGSRSSGSNDLPDKDHEGYGGWIINQIARRVDGWLNSYQPDVVMLMIGTNDTSVDGNTVANRLDNLIDDITDNTSFSGDLIVGDLPPIHPDSRFARRIPNTQTYNDLIPGVVADKQAEGKKITFAEIGSRLTVDDLEGVAIDNGLHPSAAGYREIANYWYEAFLETVGETDNYSNLNDIIGSTFNDLIVGDNQSNYLQGGAGDDTLSGGNGADTFAYNSTSEGIDLIQDFNAGEGDILQISAHDFGGGLRAGTNLSNHIANTGVFVSGANPRAVGTSANFLYDTNSGILSFDQDGINSGSALNIAVLEGTPSLSINQFHIV